MPDTHKIIPIEISATNSSPLSYRPIDRLTSAVFDATYTAATKDVLQILLQMNPMFFPERGSVWFNYEIICERDPRIEKVLIDKTGDIFPDKNFARNCRVFCQEKVARTISAGVRCSHQNRDPLNSKWGGSAQLELLLLLVNEDPLPVTLVGANSGRKEWEDLAITLGVFHYLDLVTFDDPQVQEILRLADESVAHDPANRPANMTITQFTALLFEKIDEAIESAK